MAHSERPILFDPLSDIANKKFTVVMRGYDRDEVDEFLSKLELSFKGALHEAKVIATRLENAAKAQCAELLEDALQRRRVLDDHQREITKRLDHLDEAFADLRKVTEEFPDYTPTEVPTLESARIIDVRDEATKPGVTAAAKNRKRPVEREAAPRPQAAIDQGSSSGNVEPAVQP